MSVFTDCTLPCGGPREPIGDPERWELLCLKCGRRTPMPPAFTDEQIRVMVRTRPAQGPTCAGGNHWQCTDFDCACRHHVDRLADVGSKHWEREP